MYDNSLGIILYNSIESLWVSETSFTKNYAVMHILFEWKQVHRRKRCVYLESKAQKNLELLSRSYTILIKFSKLEWKK